MSDKKVYRVIGLMSGTSLDGVDVALLETDGEDHIKPLDFASFPYTEERREAIRAAFGKQEDVYAEDVVTQAHIEAIQKTGWEADLIGFHGQTIYHAPDDGVTVQIGNGDVLAKALNTDVVADFRTADVKAGGQGAPLLPLYHYARLRSQDVTLPAAVLNIGGVGNVTYCGGGLDVLMAFDTGPGNAMIDDWVLGHTGAPFDKDGKLARAGSVNQALLAKWMESRYFAMTPPKSLDRDEWDIATLGPLAMTIEQASAEDGAATLTEFTVQSIAAAQRFFPQSVKSWYVCGGGRHNTYMMERLQEELNSPLQPVEALGWNGDATEAEGFAYLAVRALNNQPITFTGTTGVAKPLSGGILCETK